ncbi:phosphatidylinositol-specific phospholipase C domain-containing protein [Streptomyces sp. OfavH-34-F]|uniref:phosphatidylinositol-specific phospholipase C domain-containing protein n=1 Tax=Streptomyces sp. OfavH-34-F TaxID=2917760 RepID=UPI001EF1B7AF|nr:phosphatidylinositol-specific phospholipase C domain-containing protein [Streptomyces sp. OfavH-34-F]MCG7528557.1 phosphatidylinositol-specific phospholipase C domain-containing protein [Streptomyces sp. OfavH-34-F]
MNHRIAETAWWRRAATLLTALVAMAGTIAVLSPGTAWAALPDDTDNPAYRSLGKADNPDWMKPLGDRTSIGALSVPGTHETLSIRGGDSTYTQQNGGPSAQTLAAQLQAGIRSIDIRVRVIGGSFTIHHGKVYQDANFADVLAVLGQFLTAHPGETVMMHLRAECDNSAGPFSFDCKDEPSSTTSADRVNVFRSYLDQDPNARFFWAPAVSGAGQAAVPTLGEVRGKIVLERFRNVGEYSDDYGLPDDAFSIQDEYKVPDILGGIDTKVEQVVNHLTKADNDTDPQHIYLNYTSGSSTGAYPKAVADRVNERVLGPIGAVRNRTGEVLMDYPGYAMINTIIGLNRPAPEPPGWQVPRLAVMPLGDSITLGVGSGTRTGYRPALASALAGHAGAVEFVGSQVDADGVTHHEGHSGWLIEQLQANIETWLADARPNVVTLHIGTNDMNRDNRVSTAPQRLGTLIDQIHTASPDTAVVVASLVPATDPAVQARVDAYNRAIPGIVADRTQRGYKLAQVSMGALTTADLNDNLHPNNAGYAKMADAFLGGVADVAGRGWIKETVEVKPAPPRGTSALGDYDVDVNGDGRADYLVVGANGSVQAWLNTADPATGGVKWSDQGVIASGSSAWTGDQIRFADVGGDERADYLVLDPANGAVHAYINTGGNGRGGWQDKGVIATGSSAWTGAQVRFADVGGDTRADYLVVAANGATRALLNTTDPATGNVKWSDQGVIASGSSAWTADQVRFADIGGDARADYLVVAEQGATHAYVNTGGDGRGGWSDQGVVATGSSGWLAGQIRFADISGDGRADYLVLDENGAIHAYLHTTGTTGAVKWADQGVIATGTGAPASSVRI